MAHTFRIHKGADAQNDGWQKSEELTKSSDERRGINSINDEIEGGNAGKIGTSIPTPFARIYLFETAFAFASANRGARDYNFYDQLITQSLDLLQFLFENGKDERLKFYEWNGEAQIRLLTSNRDAQSGHKALAEALNMAIQGNRNLSRIILIEYDGILLGGTSPMTLTFTSPNAVRMLEEREKQILSNDRSRLFHRGHVKHLRQRSVEFQKYICWLVRHMEFMQDNTPLIYFKNYVKSQNLPEFADEELKGEYYGELSRQFSGRDVRLSVFGQVVLRFNDAPIDMEDSDFLMRPSINCYGNIPVPVVLPTDGDAAYEGWRYTTDETWNLMTTVGYYLVENTPLENRFLPVNGATDRLSTNKYPWLSTDDFFEKSIVSLGFDLNKDHFYFPVTQDKGAQFLLPIKKTYFKYFTLKDLQENLSCNVVLGSNDIPKEVTFRLKIKLKNRTDITLSRRYAAAGREQTEFSIVESQGMSFGVFPFYRCYGEGDRKNEYSIYLYGMSSDTKYANLYFHKQNESAKKLDKITDSDTAGTGEGLVRTANPRAGFSKVYNLRNETSNSFDLIEVEFQLNGKKAYSGLAIPLWPDLPEADSNKKAIISVDFGTSNTYVSYLEDGKAKPLSISDRDQQMVLLNDKSIAHGTQRAQYRNGDDFGRAQYMAQYLREFVPSVIGNPEIIVSEEYIDFPIKTATLEKQNFLPTDKLFSGISIGFNIDNETTAVDEARFNYVTNLKWNAEEHRANASNANNVAEYNKDRNRIKAFCDQILWMLKNKLIMKGYSTEDGQMMYFYPDSMSPTGRKIFREAWNDSVAEIFTKRGFTIDVKEELEAISPYYSLLVLQGDRIYKKSTANIDVGGGTTDYFILDQSRMTLGSAGAEAGKAYEASIFFAGNDLWGATYPESLNNAQYQKNGFVSYMKDMIPYCEKKEEARNLFDSYGKNKGVADLSGFFFKNDAVFGFSDKISNNRKFKFVVFLHYAGIIYHFTEILKVIKSKEPEFKYPEVLTFTGKGSEYVHMITEDQNALSQITTDLIKAFGIQDFKRIDIIRVDNPKALTADGGIYEMMSNSALTIHLFDGEAYGARQSANITNTPYERIGKSCLGLPIREDGTAYKNSEVVNVSGQALTVFENFVQTIFHSPILNGTRTYLQFDIHDEDYQKIMELARQSYQIHAMRFFENNVASASEDLRESVFFFALKNTLINLSTHYYDNLYKQEK